jgi:hypothetical protein
MAIVALVMMALLPSSMRRRLHHCSTSIVALVACCQAGVVAIVMMALLLSMCRHLCHHNHCNCHPHENGIVVVVNAQTSLPSSSWHCCPCNNGIMISAMMCEYAEVALDPRQRYCPRLNGIVAILKLVSLPLLQRRLHHH